jgi:hypothetical protein
MKKLTSLKTFAFLFTLLFISFTVVKAQVSVLTQHNDLKRTGWNSNEKILRQGNVSSGSFGKVFSRRVDDQIYAQPLVVSNLSINGKVRNVVFVATVSNSVYAFDADDATASTYLWKVNLTKSGYRPVHKEDVARDGACQGNYTDFSGNMGIVGTPVIDASANTLYVVARSVTKTTPLNFVQYLCAIDIRTGAFKPNTPPVFITATVNGTGEGSVNGRVTFDQERQNQRPGLLLYNGVVYISWSSHCDWSPYHGWVIGYDAKTLQQKYVYNNTPNGKQAGIWMAGQAPSVDDNGFIYLATGNGTVGLNGDPNNPVNRGESLLKMSTASGNLRVVDFFTPSNYEFLEAHDQDYGCDGVLLIPNSNLSLSGSKLSTLYLVNTNKMGKTSATDSGAIQQIYVQRNSTSAFNRHIHGSPVYFKSATGQEYIYVWAEYGLLRQVPFNRTTMKFDTARTIVGTTVLPDGMPGSMLAVSSNGQTAGTGILWATHPLQGDALRAVVPGILQAFDASNVTRELWNSNMIPARDSIGRFAKWVCPTIANGKVYMATFSNQLVVYGLLPAKSVIAKADNINSSISSEAKLTLTPNPAQRQVTLVYQDSKAGASEKARVDIFGSTGNIIYQKEVIINNGGNLHLNITLPSTIQNGVYTVRIADTKGTYKTEKLVISN